MSKSIISVENVRGYQDEAGTAWLNIADVAHELGFVQNKGGVEYPRYDRISGWLKEFDFPLDVGKDTYVPENVFYRLAMKASNEKAKKFQAKVANVILPAIRKHGFYATQEKIEEIVRNPDLFIGHLINAYERVKSERDTLKGEVALLKPKADYCEKILQSPEALNVTVIAKDYGMSGQTFNQLLWSMKIQYKSGKTYVLYQPYASLGYAVTETVVTRNGSTATQMRWTQKGRMFLYNTLKKAGIVPVMERENPMAELL